MFVAINMRYALTVINYVCFSIYSEWLDTAVRRMGHGILFEQHRDNISKHTEA